MFGGRKIVKNDVVSLLATLVFANDLGVIAENVEDLRI